MDILRTDVLLMRVYDRYWYFVLVVEINLITMYDIINSRRCQYDMQYMKKQCSVQKNITKLTKKGKTQSTMIYVWMDFYKKLIRYPGYYNKRITYLNLICPIIYYIHQIYYYYTIYYILYLSRYLHNIFITFTYYIHRYISLYCYI